MDEVKRPDPNDRQIDGQHYREANKNYQHWDLVADYGMSYFIGNMTKYVSRWKKKHGLTDLEKALHYLDKLMALEADYRFLPKRHLLLPTDRAKIFCKEQELGELETEIIVLSVQYKVREDLFLIHTRLTDLISQVKNNELPEPYNAG